MTITGRATSTHGVLFVGRDFITINFGQKQTKNDQYLLYVGSTSYLEILCLRQRSKAKQARSKVKGKVKGPSIKENCELRPQPPSAAHLPLCFVDNLFRLSG
jgi:hypothetical protein